MCDCEAVGQAPTSYHAAVRDFHARYGQHIGTLADDGFYPGEIALGWRLLDEEVVEMRDAFRSWFGYGGDVELAALVKEMADVLYTVVGLGVRLGVDMDRMFALVDAANKTKAGVDGSGKVVKGAGYVEPDIRGELIAQWSEVICATQRGSDQRSEGGAAK